MMNHGDLENFNYFMKQKKNVLNYIQNVIIKELNGKYVKIHHHFLKYLFY